MGVNRRVARAAWLPVYLYSHRELGTGSELAVPPGVVGVG